MSKSRIELLGQAIDRRRAGLARAEATAYVRVDVRQLLSGWEAWRLCARSEPGCTDDRATAILLQAFSSGEVGLVHKSGALRHMLRKEDWTKCAVDLHSGKIDHPSGVDLDHLHVSALDLLYWLAEYRGETATPKRGAAPRLPEQPEFSDRTGARGRPSSAHLAKAEFQRRAEAGEAFPKLVDEAKYLSRWVLTRYPDLAPMKPATVGDRIRRDFQKWKAAK